MYVHMYIPQGIGVFLSVCQVHDSDVLQYLHLVADLPSPGSPGRLGRRPQVREPLLRESVACDSVGTYLEIEVRVDWREKMSGCGQSVPLVQMELNLRLKVQHLWPQVGKYILRLELAQ